MPTFDTHTDVPPSDPAYAVANDAPRRERRDAAAHRQRILAAARTLFDQQGVDATSMYEIARTAGVGQGTLYRRFAHKGELCIALLGERIAQFQADADAQLAARADQPALDQLAQMFRDLIRFGESNHPLLGAIEDAACGERRTPLGRAPFYTWLRARTVDLIEQAVARGEIAPLDIQATVDSVLAVFAIHVYQYQRLELGLGMDQISDALLHFLLHGLRGQGQTMEYNNHG